MTTGTSHIYSFYSFSTANSLVKLFVLSYKLETLQLSILTKFMLDVLYCDYPSNPRHVDILPSRQAASVQMKLILRWRLYCLLCHIFSLAKPSSSLEQHSDAPKVHFTECSLSERVSWYATGTSLTGNIKEFVWQTPEQCNVSFLLYFLPRTCPRCNSDLFAHLGYSQAAFPVNNMQQ